MGNHPKKEQKSLLELKDCQASENQYYDELVNYRHCCGFRVKKTQKFVLIWQQTLIRNCQQLKLQYPYWTSQIIEIVKNVNLPRAQFVKEISNLKDQQNQRIQQKQEILLSPSEIEEFKENIRKSILLSSAQALKSRPKETSKIETMIIATPTKKQRIKNKNDEILTQFRKSNLSSYKKSEIKEKSGLSPNTGFRHSMISLVDDTLSSLIRGQQKDISKNGAHNLEIFVKFTVIIENHLNNPQNKLNRVLLSFVESIRKRYNKQMNSQKEMENFTNNIKAFLVIFRDAVENYYNTPAFGDMNETTNFLISNPENILTVVTSMLFKNEQFYNFLFTHVRNSIKQETQKLAIIFNRYSDKPPQFFEVKDEYCINKCTFKQKGEQQGIKLTNQYYQTNRYPYKSCVQSLNQLANCKTPISKMKVLLETAKGITECVKQFYEYNKMNLKDWIFDADQILSIFCYIIPKTQITDLYCHLFVLEHFATENQMISMMGYYYSVICCALEQLERLEDGQRQQQLNQK